MPASVRRKPAVLLLLLFLVGVAWAVGYAVASGRRGANPAVAGDSVGAGTVAGGNGAQPPGAPPAGAGGGRPVGEFFIRGRVEGLVPGRPATLPLTITNPNPWPIQVRTVDVGVGAPGGAACPASTLRVGRYTAADGHAVSAPARGTAVVTVAIELADSSTRDQSGCPGSTFPLSFTGTAVQGAR